MIENLKIECDLDVCSLLQECSTWGTIVDILEQGGWAKKHLIISQVVDTCTIYYLCYCPSAND